MSEERRQESASEGSFVDSIFDSLVSGDTATFSQIHEELNGKSNHDVAVAGGCLLDVRLKEAIKTRLRVSDKYADELLGRDEESGSIDFHSLCTLAYCLGLIGEIGLADLRRIGTIRNRLGNRGIVNAFAHEKVRQLCMDLQSPEMVDRLCGSSKPIVDRLAALGTDNDIMRNRFTYSVLLLYIMPWATVAECPMTWPHRSNPTPIFW